MFNTNASYEALGIHPTGLGIDRYRSAEDLTDEESSYGETVTNIMFLTLISPMTIGINRISLGKGRYFNFAIPVYLNGFGYDINPEVYFKTPKYNFFVGIHNYRNYENNFLGIESGIFKMKTTILNKELTYDARMMLWVQPENQEFRSNNSAFGGLGQIKIYYSLNKWLSGFLDVEDKSAGWVAGNPFLNSNVSFRVGCSMTIDD